MSGDIPHGAYSYVLSRHENLLVILGKMVNGETGEKIIPKPLSAYEVAAWLTIDLRSGTKDEKLIEDWWKFFRAHGFTGTHKLFEIPIIPKPQLEPVH